MTTDLCNSNTKSNFLTWEPDLPFDFKFSEYPSVVDRYFTKKFYRPVEQHQEGKWATTCVLLHSNGVCLVCLSPCHPVVVDPHVVIDSVDFQTGPKTNRLETKPIGKSKKFAQIIKREDELLCRLVTSDGTVYRLAAGVRGRLIEVNELVSTSPTVIKSRPLTDGYIAVIMPPRHNNPFTSNHHAEDDFDGQP